MRGRIYERRCDLSPDGKHFIYFAMNGRWDSETKGAWTAISRTPYLKAVTLLAKGDCWQGGGLFSSNKSYWLNGGQGHTTLQDSREVRRDSTFTPSANYGAECKGVYYLRLLRDGWKLVKQVNESKWRDVDVFEKSLRGGWVLRKFAHAEIGSPPGKGCYWDEHEIEHAASATIIPCPEWEWAEVDRNWIVWVAGGQLWAGYLRRKELCDMKMLHDFNDMKFEAIAAPY